MEKEQKKNKKGVGYSEEELKKLPKEQQEKIIKARKDRENALNEKANMSLEYLENETVSDREYNAKFNRIYSYVRQALVILKAKKTTKALIGEQLYSETCDMLDRAKEL